MVKKSFILLIVFIFLTIPMSAFAASKKDKHKTEEKNPWAAAAFSFVIPGTGQIYIDEEVWPNILITVGFAAVVATYFLVDQQRDRSIRPRTIKNNPIEQNLPDAHWQALTLALQVALPSYWIWNFGNAYNRAEEYNKKVINNLNPNQKSDIMKDRFVSITLWRF